MNIPLGVASLPLRCEQFWFARIPPASYALLRIAIGVLGFVSVVSFSPVPMFWPISGIAPLPGGGIGLRSWLETVGLGTAAGWAYFVALLTGFLCIAAGYRSRAAIAICYLGSVLQKPWNHLPLSSAHEVLIVVLFCLVWVDSGAVLSLDAYLARRRSSTAHAVPAPAAAPIWPLRLIQFQVALIYFNSGLWKLLGPMWRDGTAVHYALSSNIFHRFPAPFPAEGALLLTLGAYTTLAWEIAFPLLLLHRWTRRGALVMGLFIHGGIWFGMEVGAFSWLMVSTYLAFVDPRAIERWLRRLLRKQRVAAAV